LWEALFGERPFAGETFGDLRAAVTKGALRTPSSRRGVPRWLQRVVERGLAVSPERRHASVDALLTALHADPTRRRRWLGLGLGVALSAAAALGAHALQRERATRACEAEGARVDEVWNGVARAVLREGLLAGAAPFAAQSVERSLPYLDAQAESWRRARVESCMDARVRGVWDEDMHERARWCLDDRLMELESTISTLSSAESNAAERAVQIVAKLQRVDRCRDARTLLSLPAPPPDGAASEQLRAQLAQVGAMVSVGRFNEALRDARRAESEAVGLGWAPLMALAHQRVGDALEQTGDLDGAEAQFLDAYFTAMRADAIELAGHAAMSLMFAVGVDQRRGDDAIVWARHVDVLLAAQGVEEGDLRRAVFNTNFANTLLMGGEFERARALGERAVKVFERELGPAHPLLAAALMQLAMTQQHLGDYDIANAYMQRARDMYEATLGPEHPHVADILVNFGGLYSATHSHDRAIELYEQALALYERTLGPEHPRVGAALHNLASALQDSGADLERALALNKRALAIDTKTYGEAHPYVAGDLCSAASIQLKLGRPEEAQALSERALELWERSLGPEHPDVAVALLNLSRAARAQGRAADAIAPATRALALLEANESPPDKLAECRYELARALWEAPGDAGGDRERARELATRAQEELRAITGRVKLVVDVDFFVQEIEEQIEAQVEK
ncbi:MAG: tetratricopeptide repeat protein, partial [Myxococcales bacterium]|nr:tetratricopeptide repeat protein [Myxococcales bacterium]